ncbi:MAG: hypothetical protein JW846_03560 [Dehalococcoidia bacterium]|nr:hypothetical protein [Dehalococcoidia bacterium]
MKVDAVQASPVLPMNRDAIVDIASRACTLASPCFVVLSTKYVTPCERGRAGSGNASWTFFGGSAIIGPEGDLIAGPVHDEELILHGDADCDRLVPRKASTDVSGKDNRWDIMRVESKARRYTPSSGSFGQQQSSDMTLTATTQDSMEQLTSAFESRLDAIAEELRRLRQSIEYPGELH